MYRKDILNKWDNITQKDYEYIHILQNYLGAH